MRDADDVHEAKGNVCRFRMTGNFAEDNIERESEFMSNSECVIEELRVSGATVIRATFHKIRAIRAEVSQE